jgi:hypothetical protein
MHEDLGELVWVKFKGGAQHPANLITKNTSTSAEELLFNETGSGERLVEVLWSGWTGPKAREWVPACNIEPDKKNNQNTSKARSRRRTRRTSQEAVQEEEEVRFGRRRRHCEEEEEEDPVNKKKRSYHGSVKTRASRDGSSAAAVASTSTTAHASFSIALPVTSVASREPRIARQSPVGSEGGTLVDNDLSKNIKNDTRASPFSQGVASMPRKNVKDGNIGAHHTEGQDIARYSRRRKMLARKPCSGPSFTTATTTGAMSADCPSCQKEGSLMKRQRRRPQLGDSLIVQTLSRHAADGNKEFAIVTVVGESCLFRLRRHSQHRCCECYPRLLQAQFKTPDGAIRTEYVPEHVVMTPSNEVTAVSATRKDDFTIPKAGQKEDEDQTNPFTIVTADTATTTSKNNCIGNDEQTSDLTAQVQSSSFQETLINTTNVVYRNLAHATAAQQEKPMKLQDIVDRVHEDLGLDDTDLSFRTIANRVVELLQQKESPPGAKQETCTCM